MWLLSYIFRREQRACMAIRRRDDVDNTAIRRRGGATCMREHTTNSRSTARAQQQKPNSHGRRQQRTRNTMTTAKRLYWATRQQNESDDTQLSSVAGQDKLQQNSEMKKPNRTELFQRRDSKLTQHHTTAITGTKNGTCISIISTEAHATTTKSD